MAGGNGVVAVGSIKESKAERTRRTILESAMSLILEEGYEKATMRSIAKAAGLSAGAAYYYFPSKEHIVQQYYEEGYDDQVKASRAILATERKLAPRLAGVLRVHMEVAAPYHEVSRALFATAADPAHPISPFSAESKELRDRHIALFEELLGGTSDSLSGLPKKFRERLPELLWLYKMGIILYWVHDRSPGQRKTFGLIEVSARLVARVIGAAKLPGVKTLANRGVDMYDEFRVYD